MRTDGFMLGYTTGLGAGWADQVLAHRSMLHTVPAAVSEAAAVLHEPLSVAVHGLLRRPPADGEPVLIVGAGIIGLSAVAAVRALFGSSEVTIVAKHEHQQAAASALGAHRIVVPAPDGSHISELAEIAGTGVRGAGSMSMLAGGFPYVVEAVGTAGSINECLRTVDGTGTVLFLGATGATEVDLTPLWFKEVSIVGSFCHARDPFPGHHDSSGTPEAEHSIDRSLAILAAGGLPHELVITHEFALDDVRSAVETALGKGETGAIKVVLRP